MPKVRKRGGFSDRNGVKPENTEIQLKKFDDRTRIALSNIVSRLFVTIYADDSYDLRYRGMDFKQAFLKYILRDVYSEQVDERKDYREDYVLSTINKTILNEDYDDVLTLIEAIAQYWHSYMQESFQYMTTCTYTETFGHVAVYEVFNSCFKQEYVGYRFIGAVIVPISDSFEVNTITEALSGEFQTVNEHLNKANKMLSDREMPDYENSIKESISAVEALCEILTGIKGKEATLGKMIKTLENKGIRLHGSLKAAFNNLYGYTSDAKGIRHAGDIGGPAATFEEAKFMLVSCSAFINYLIAVNSNL